MYVALFVTSPAVIFNVAPVATAVLPPSLYQLIVPSAVRAAPVTSVPAVYTWAVSVVWIALFLKIVPFDEVIASVMASAPASPVSPLSPSMLLTYTHLAVEAAPAVVQRFRLSTNPYFESAKKALSKNFDSERFSDA